ncbi:MAG: TonB-dependent receptor [Bacteroidota bacterium]|nr:TonB-dependent receptor [Bacteroidota bacterium]
MILPNAKTNKTIINLLMVFCIYVSQAQTPDTSKLNKTQNLEDVVVTAQYQPNTIDKSTYKIKVIDAEKIQALAAVNLKDALSNELNIRFSQDPVLGSSISLQGLSGQNVKILIDGVALIGRQNGNLDLSQININNIERIEIVEGPLSVTYGTNALAGVINIITKKPKTNSVGAGLNLYYETNNTYNAGLNFSARKKSHGFTANINRNYFNGWNIKDKQYLVPEKTLADTNRFKSWKPKEQYFGDIQYNFEKSKFKLNYRTAYFNELIVNRGFPLKPYYEAAFDDYYKTQRLDNTLYTNIKFKNFKSYNNTLAYNYYRRDKTTYYKNLTDLTEQLSPDSSLQDTAVFTAAMARGSFISSKPYETWEDTIAKHNWLNYELGYDLNYNYALGKRIKNKTQVIGDYAAFASAEIQPYKNFIIRPGLRYAYNTVYKSPLTPSFNIKFNINHWTFRASYAKGFRAPDLKELYFEFVDINHNIFGNTELKPEQSDNYNLNVKFSRKKLDKDFSFDVSAFYNDIDNLITLALLSGSQYSYINIGKFKSYGTSLNGTYTHKKLTLSAGTSLIARYNDLSSDFSNVEEFSYTPEARASVQYKIEKWKTYINCFYKYSGKLPGYNQNSDGTVSQTFVQDFHMLDANISKQLFKNRLSLSAGVKNVLNVNNVTASLAGGAHSGNSSSTPIAMGRTYFIKLQYAFEK